MEYKLIRLKQNIMKTVTKKLNNSKVLMCKSINNV